MKASSCLFIKWIITGWALLLLPHEAPAQWIMAGAKAGLHFTTLEANTDQNAQPGLGVHAGILLNVASSDLFSLQPEWYFSYSQVESRIQHQPDSAASGLLRTDTKRQLQYTEVPILARFTVGNRVRASAAIGPTLGFLLKAEEEITQTSRVNGALDTESEALTVTPTYRDHNIGLAGELAVEYNNAFIGLRYQMGLTDLDTNPEVDIQTRTFYLTGGYVLYF